MDIQLSNIPQFSVDKLVKELSGSYSSFINQCISIQRFPSVMLWGSPGVGKSRAVKQIAEEIKSLTGKEAYVTDVRLLLFNPIDLRGIPTYNEDRTLAVWLKPKIFQMDESNDVVNILFLDEISAAPQSVQAAAYQITLDRMVGEHKLPDNCIVIAAGNKVTDKSVSYKMPRALANRMMHIEVIGNVKSWCDWAKMQDLNPLVIEYIENNPGKLLSDNAISDDLAYATPRTWEMVSEIINGMDGDVNSAYQLISAVIGLNNATHFKLWCKERKIYFRNESEDNENNSFPLRPELSRQFKNYSLDEILKRISKRVDEIVFEEVSDRCISLFVGLINSCCDTEKFSTYDVNKVAKQLCPYTGGNEIILFESLVKMHIPLNEKKKKLIRYELIQSGLISEKDNI